MRVLHVLPTRAEEYGGPVRVAEALFAQTMRHGHSATIYPAAEGAHQGVRRTAYWPGLRALRTLCAEVRAADLIHIHGLWTVPTSAAAICARATNRPFIITPHGMLDRWSLRHHARRKRVYAALIERKNLATATALHFFNEGERTEAQDFGIRAPTFLLANGVDVERYADLPRREVLASRYPQTKDRIVLLFLGRIHPKKGLPLLIDAVAGLLARHSDVHLVIAGPDEGGHRAEVERLIASKNLGDHVLFTGPVRGEDKRVLLGGADVFVLPSHQEGDAVAVKEALAAGLPVVITHQCHYSEVAAANAGLVVNTRASEIRDALERLCGDNALRARMSLEARQLIEQRYRWDMLGAELTQQYERLLMRHHSAKCGGTQ